MGLGSVFLSTEGRIDSGESTLLSKPIEVNPLDALGVIYLTASVLLAVAAQLVLKLGLLNSGGCDDQWVIPCLSRKIVTGPIVLGVSLHLIDTLFWCLALSRLDLSFAYPVSSLQFILIFAASWYVLGEHIGSLRLVGIMVICAGIIVMSLDARRI